MVNRSTSKRLRCRQQKENKSKGFVRVMITPKALLNCAAVFSLVKGSVETARLGLGPNRCCSQGCERSFLKAKFRQGPQVNDQKNG
jgi:hypothetical protein